MASSPRPHRAQKATQVGLPTFRKATPRDITLLAEFFLQELEGSREQTPYWFWLQDITERHWNEPQWEQRSVRFIREMSFQCYDVVWVIFTSQEFLDAFGLYLALKGIKALSRPL